MVCTPLKPKGSRARNLYDEVIPGSTNKWTIAELCSKGYGQPCSSQLLEYCPGNMPKVGDFVTSHTGYPGRDVPHSILSGRCSE